MKKMMADEIIPAIEEKIKVGITQATADLKEEIKRQISEDMQEQMQVQNERIDRMKKNVSLVTLKHDALDQYGRRECLRFVGVPEDDSVGTSLEIIKIATALGVELEERDISTSHRLGKKNPKGPRTIVAKFVRRDKRNEIMSKKKALNDIDGMSDIKIYEHLTPLRAKVLRELQGEPNRKAWSFEGKIFTKSTNNGKEVTVVIETSEDLRKIGWTDERIRKTGLSLED